MEVEEADATVAKVGANEKSDRLTRKDFMGLVLQDAKTESLLEENGVNVDTINSTAPMPEWEKELRRKYVASAKDEIIERFETLSQDQLARDFPTDTWWGRTAREIYKEKLPKDNTMQKQIYPSQ